MSTRETVYEILNINKVEGSNDRYVSCQIAPKGSRVGDDCITVDAAPLWMVQELVSKANLCDLMRISNHAL